MAIYLYYGKVGDGKSYHVVATEILPAVRDGRKIYCYMDGLNPRRLSQHSGRNADVVLWDTVEQAREACQLEPDDREGVGLKVDRGALIIVDESQMVWDSREWQKTGKAAMTFFEYHRHFGLDVILITQAPGRLDKALVRLANECLHVKNLRFLAGPLGGRYVVNVRQTPQDREPITTIRGKFDQNVFACYRSATAVRGAKVHGRGIKGPLLWGPALAAVALVLYVRGGGIATLQGKAGTVTNTDLSFVGKQTPESEWPRPGPELARLDPPTPGITGNGRGPEPEPVGVPTAKVQAVQEEPEVVGVVEVDGVKKIIYKTNKKGLTDSEL